jgi:UDP-hydrolysing UDP-N-acetyl-D-glucosamine 2-epimerase
MRYETVEEDTRALMDALAECGEPVVFTAANADTNGRLVNAAIREFVSKHDSSRLVENFGAANYFSMLRYSAAMVGNSSSGILEAPAFGLPVVNIGDRQAGRTRGGNVVDVGRSREEILAGIRRALAPAFRSSAQSAPNPYGDGHAAEKIVAALKSVQLGDDLVVKRFWDGA